MQGVRFDRLNANGLIQRSPKNWAQIKLNQSSLLPVDQYLKSQPLSVETYLLRPPVPAKCFEQSCAGDQASARYIEAAYIRIKRCGLRRDYIQVAHCPSYILVIKESDGFLRRP